MAGMNHSPPPSGEGSFPGGKNEHSKQWKWRAAVFREWKEEVD